MSNSHRFFRAFLAAVAVASSAALLLQREACGEAPSVDPRVAPGATITLEFPEFGTMHHEKNLTGRVEVYVPTDWRPERQYPLVCWFGGGYGTHKADALKGITAGKGYVCVALPYRPAEEGTGVGWREQDGGWGTSWRHYVPILAEVERVVPNIDPERRAVMGFSSGGAAVGCMIDETKDFTDYFHAFGVAGYAWWHRKSDRLKGRPVLMYGGGNDNRMNSREGNVSRYKACGADPEVIVYEGVGHAPPPPQYRPKLRDWLERKVARRGLPEAMARMKSTLAAKRWRTALQFAQKVLNVAGDRSPEQAAAREAIVTISAAGEREIGKLLAGSPRPEKLREFAASWAPCQCAETARDAADGVAARELGRIVELSGHQRVSKLRTFLSEWEGYPACDKALAAYEEDAAKALAALEKGFVSTSKLRRFIDKWSPAPSAQRALEKLDELAGEELAKIMVVKSSSSRKSRLKSLARKYEGTRSASKAQDALKAILEEEAGKVLAGIKTRRAREQKRLLAAFLRSYPGTDAAREAKKLLDDLSRRR